MKNIYPIMAWMFLFFHPLYGVGVPAGTIMKNIAILSYTSDEINYTRQSNEVTDVVAQFVDLKLEWLDSVAPIVESGENAKVLTFRLTNLGNDQDSFALSMAHKADSTFTVENSKLISDSNGNGVYDAGIDGETTGVTLHPDESIILFIVADIPELDISTSGYANELITVESLTDTLVDRPLGDENSTVVAGITGGESSVIGSYHSLAYKLNMSKSATVKNQIGTAIPTRGAIITYTILLDMEGIGEIHNIVLNDTIPEGTRYEVGSLLLDGNPLSDGLDEDAGSFASNTISVKIGTMKQTASLKPQHHVRFNVRIQ